MDCIPPWLSNKNQCYKNMSTYNHTTYSICIAIFDNFQTPKENSQPTEAEEKCMIPCMKMTNKVFLRSDGVEKRMSFDLSLILRFKKTVKFERKVVVYTWFNFIVDVGSSLGLWLGLSALSITELTFKAFMLIKKWLKLE